MAYCEQHQIRYHVFHYWYLRYKEKDGSSERGGFVLLQLAPRNSSTVEGFSELVLADGRHLVYHHPVKWE